MTAFSYSDTPYPIRSDLGVAHRRYWEELARPGNWWTGAERVAIADEVRRAWECALCEERKTALSPYAVDGEHDAARVLPEAAIDAVHRIVTDASRLSKVWLEKTLASGLGDAHYVELLGIAVAVVSIDRFHHNIGIPPEPLPEPQPGEPSRHRPASAEPGDAWVPWIPAGKATGPEAGLYPDSARAPNVFCAMSLVPDAVRALASLSSAQYVPLNIVAKVAADLPNRALDRMQIELLAGRTSAVNECFY